MERSGKRYSGKPDGVAGTPKFRIWEIENLKNWKLKIENWKLKVEGQYQTLSLFINFKIGHSRMLARLIKIGRKNI